ncbi:MAG: prepilin peptidase [Erysipelothrix sp.]|nr:prepilin peptidase [Erysipelothrix sp.]
MYYLISFIFGLIIGSFLGVIIDRLPLKLSIATGRSRCDTCNRNLTAFELIPIFSYFIQGAKCKNCKTPLSFRYPLLELITGFSFLLVYHNFGLTLETLFGIIFTSILIIIAFIDIDTMLIYDRFHIIIIVLAIIEAFVFKKNLIHLLIASLIVSIPLLIVANITGGMGGGDIKLMFASGLLLGINKIIVAFVIAVVIGGTYGIITLLNKKHKSSDAIPFGPYLCLGLYISMLYGLSISTWYLSLLS